MGQVGRMNASKSTNRLEAVGVAEGVGLEVPVGLGDAARTAVGEGVVVSISMGATLIGLNAPLSAPAQSVAGDRGSMATAGAEPPQGPTFTHVSR
jgi:hypothetical protein